MGWICLLYKFVSLLVGLKSIWPAVVLHTRMASGKMTTSTCSGTTKRCCVFSCDTMRRPGAFESFSPRAGVPELEASVAPVPGATDSGGTLRDA